MRMYGNDIEIVRGESFTIDKLLVNEDGSPYIVGDMTNPKWHIIVNDAEHGKAVRAYELDVFKKFKYSIPIKLTDLGNKDGQSLYKSFDDIKSLTEYEGTKCVAFTQVSGETIGYEPDDAVFYIDDDYRYWDTDSEGWKKYECSIVQPFLSVHTDLPPKTYYWGILLVDDSGTILNILSQSKLIIRPRLKGVIDE